ncbi:hypothetical protein CL654_02500 [bacterium]|nr:hypothetical protein [bacterium]|tara:strand:- start:261 stop:758 length:498 start_codon:yes stop_codon:yes gene_type:complete
MNYFKEEDLPTLFDLIYRHYSKQEPMPPYDSQEEGCKKLKGVLIQVTNDIYYPTLLEKAAYLLVQINKGHFFENGNKRLALVTTLGFLLINNAQFSEHTKEEYSSLVKELFPSFNKYQDFGDFNPEEFGLYNLSIIVADSVAHEPDFEALKKKVEKFLKFTTKSV